MKSCFMQTLLKSRDALVGTVPAHLRVWLGKAALLWRQCCCGGGGGSRGWHEARWRDQL